MVLTCLIAAIVGSEGYLSERLLQFEEAKGITREGVVFGTPKGEQGIRLYAAKPDLMTPAKTWRHWEHGAWIELPLPVDYVRKFRIADLIDSGTAVGSFSDPLVGEEQVPAAIVDGRLLTIGPATDRDIESSMSIPATLTALNEDGTAIGFGRMSTSADALSVFPIILFLKSASVWFPTIEDSTLQGFLFDINSSGVAVGHDTWGHTPMWIDTKNKTVAGYKPTISFSHFTHVLDDGRVLWLRMDEPIELAPKPFNVSGFTHPMKIDGIRVSRVFDVNNHGSMVVKGSRDDKTPFFGVIRDGKCFDLSSFLTKERGVMSAFINDSGLIVINSDGVLLLRPN